MKRLLKMFGLTTLSNLQALKDNNGKLNAIITDYAGRHKGSYPTNRNKLKPYLGNTVVVTGILTHVSSDNKRILLKMVKLGKAKVAHHLWIDTPPNYAKHQGNIVTVEGKVYKYFNRNSSNYENLSIKDTRIIK